MSKILVVDDDHSIRELFKTKLEDLGHNVETAMNGQQGYELAMSWNPDAVISDMQMPFLNGDEMLTKILARRPWIVCYAMSASSLWKLPAGVGLYLKPGAFSEIIQELNGDRDGL